MKSKMQRLLLILACAVPLAGAFAQAQPSPTGQNGSSTDRQSVTEQTFRAPVLPSSSANFPLQLPQTSSSNRLASESNRAEKSSTGSYSTLPEHMGNRVSDVFGAQLFTGSFAREGATQFNPDYVVAVGDTLQVRLWGSYQFDQQLTVDPQGNIFLPMVGPVRVLGVRNRDLQGVVQEAVSKVFRSNVGSYTSLAAAQPVRIFVTGFVYRPGQYSGTSMDSLLHFLDQAGGIDPERGSFLNVQVQRGAQVRASVNLYDFLLLGRIPLIQLASGDVIFVPPRQSVVKVAGLAENAKRFEFSPDKPLSVAELARIAKPLATATHVRVMRNQGAVRNAEYYPLEQASSIVLENGDDVEFTADKKPGTITVRVEGEHDSSQEYVLPYGSKLGDLLPLIKTNSRSDFANLQLYRVSVKERQKELLAASLRSLEAALLTAKSGSGDEARLRTEEAELTLKWVDRAKQIEPLGQVLIAQAAGKDRSELLLENGDRLRIPTKDGLVLVNGEVLFPNAIAWQKNFTVNDYIQRAGGYTQNADGTRIVIARLDGSFEQSATAAVRPGDQVLVLPKVDSKNRQFWKEMVQIVYQVAVSAAVVLSLPIY